MIKVPNVERPKRVNKDTQRMIVYKIQLVNKEKQRKQRIKFQEEMNNLVKLFGNL